MDIQLKRGLLAEDAKIDTGKMDVPKTITGGKCEIGTDTGDIQITSP